MRLGLHLPIGAGLLHAAQRARQLKCECLQLFSRNARGWRGRQYRVDEVEHFRELLERADISPLVLHSCYLINLASPDSTLRKRSIDTVADDMQRASLLGAPFVVFHFGHHLGVGPERGLSMVASSLQEILTTAPDGVSLLLENSAGQATELGGVWEHFSRIFELLENDPRVGLCFDSCHAHAAGHRLDNPRYISKTLRAVESALDLRRLRLLHLNDSRFPAGSRYDRHEHLGKGDIGESGLRALLAKRSLQDRCALLETPISKPGDDRRNLLFAKRLRNR